MIDSLTELFGNLGGVSTVAAVACFLAVGASVFMEVLRLKAEKKRAARQLHCEYLAELRRYTDAWHDGDMAAVIASKMRLDEMEAKGWARDPE